MCSSLFVLHRWLPLLDLNQRLPVITQLTPRCSVSCASLPSPQAPRDKRCGQPPFGLLPIKYRKSLLEFNRKKQNRKGHALRDLFCFGLIVQKCNSIKLFYTKKTLHLNHNGSDYKVFSIVDYFSSNALLICFSFCFINKKQIKQTTV